MYMYIDMFSYIISDSLSIYIYKYLSRYIYIYVCMYMYSVFRPYWALRAAVLMRHGSGAHVPLRCNANTASRGHSSNSRRVQGLKWQILGQNHNDRNSDNSLYLWKPRVLFALVLGPLGILNAMNPESIVFLSACRTSTCGVARF